MEPFDPRRHRNHMPEVGGSCDSPRVVVFVEVTNFEFVFFWPEQLEAAIEFFEHPLGSTRMNAEGGDHWEFQPWQSRLPAGLTRRARRGRVVEALVAARSAFSESS